MALAISGSTSAKDWVRIGMGEKRAGNGYLTIGGAVVAHRNTAVGADSLRAILEWSVLRRRWALIRGRLHPIRFANGTWLAAHSATWLAAHSATWLAAHGAIAKAPMSG